MWLTNCSVRADKEKRGEDGRGRKVGGEEGEGWRGRERWGRDGGRKGEGGKEGGRGGKEERGKGMGERREGGRDGNNISGNADYRAIIAYNNCLYLFIHYVW